MQQRVVDRGGQFGTGAGTNALQCRHCIGSAQFAQCACSRARHAAVGGAEQWQQIRFGFLITPIGQRVDDSGLGHPGCFGQCTMHRLAGLGEFQVTERIQSHGRDFGVDQQRFQGGNGLGRPDHAQLSAQEIFRILRRRGLQSCDELLLQAHPQLRIAGQCEDELLDLQ